MLGIIGGTGLDALPAIAGQAAFSTDTPFGPVRDLRRGNWQGAELLFLPRHGAAHALPPHRINYRANLWALRELGAREVIAVNAVGAINPGLPPGSLALPVDLIDYSWGREHSYAGQGLDLPMHVEFSPPLSPALRAELLDCGVPCHDGGVVAVTQGPRLESAAEIRRLHRDGCDLVGMTLMPEAALAAELGLPYACIAVIVNWAAGVAEGSIHADIAQHLETGIGRALRMIEAFMSRRAA